ncbi:MAG: tetratricopeptide repeat protein [Gammaproteobacteria bacterium]|nr:tetratricopeptide repeat protein [Gammaproteobacteria bacterium]
MKAAAPRRALRGAGLLFCACLGGVAWAGAPTTPYVPESAAVVLQHVPASTDPRVRRFQRVKNSFRQHPNDLGRALKLARAYVGYARSTGNARFLGRALGVVDPWMQQDPAPIRALLLHATILQSRHHFKAARNELRKILERDPENAQAWLTLATVAMVQGDYSLANDACVHLAAVGGNFMGIACTATLRSLTGRAEQAWRLFSLIKHPGPEAPDAIHAWIHGLMADTARRLGKVEAADAHYRKALQWTPGDNFLLAAYADFLLDQNRPEEVIELVREYTDSDTSFLRLVFAEAALGSPKAGRDIREMAARFAAMDRRHTHVYRREQARFVLYLLHDPERALRLAKKNWTVQRAPKDMRIFLAAALAAGKPAAAKPVLEVLAESHLQDPPVNRLARKVKAAPGESTALAEREGAQK